MDNNWFKLSPSKLLSILSSLPTGQMRAHMTLLVTIYLSDGGLPDDDEALAFRSSLPLADIQALRPYFRFLGRCEGGRLYLDFAENVIMERVEFGEKKALAGAKRWRANKSTAKPETAQQSTAKTKRAQLSTAKHSRAQLSTVKPDIHTDIHTSTDSSNELSGADALAEPQKPSGKQPDPLFQEFCLQFQTAHAGEPYAYKPADFVKLAALRDRYAKAKPQPWDVTPERFRQAAEHYFGSELATHTLADLCERFSTFFRNALDRYNKPLDSGRNGTTHVGNGAAEVSYPPIVKASPEWLESRQRREKVAE
jgi:hypothetical protein